MIGLRSVCGSGSALKCMDLQYFELDFLCVKHISVSVSILSATKKLKFFFCVNKLLAFQLLYRENRKAIFRKVFPYFPRFYIFAKHYVTWHLLRTIILLIQPFYLLKTGGIATIDVLKGVIIPSSSCTSNCLDIVPGYLGKLLV